MDEGWFTLVFTHEATKAAFTGCEGFSEVMNSERVTELTYYDNAGDAVKGVLHANFFGTITNADGKTFRDRSVFTESYGLVNRDDDRLGSELPLHRQGQGTGLRRGGPQDHDRRHR